MLGLIGHVKIGLYPVDSGKALKVFSHGVTWSGFALERSPW